MGKIVLYSTQTDLMAHFPKNVIHVIQNITHVIQNVNYSAVVIHFLMELKFTINQNPKILHFIKMSNGLLLISNELITKTPF